MTTEWLIMIGYLADAVSTHNCSSSEQVSLLGAKLEVEDTWMFGAACRLSAVVDQWCSLAGLSTEATASRGFRLAVRSLA